MFTPTCVCAETGALRSKGAPRELGYRGDCSRATQIAQTMFKDTQALALQSPELFPFPPSLEPLASSALKLCGAQYPHCSPSGSPFFPLVLPYVPVARSPAAVAAKTRRQQP